jgi:hypothetical protein
VELVASARTGSLRGAWWRGRFAGIWLGFPAILLGISACALGVEEEPGCRSDEACGEGYLCRAGACFRVTTGLTPPQDSSDAGDAGDADAAGSDGG